LLKGLPLHLLALALLVSCGKPNPQVVIRTELGDIRVELYPYDAPVTTANFLRYVDDNLFEGASFYRTVTMDNQPDNDIRIEVIQGGLAVDTSYYPPIVHEPTIQTGIKHRNGVISMARLEPGSATSEIFICVGDQPELDFQGRRNPDGQGFAAFGRVVDGMEVVRRIHTRPAEGQWLSPPIPIRNIVRVP
jgi:peptidyl-prolyl cis-trans isomerase A (cyclophilin A)